MSASAFLCCSESTWCAMIVVPGHVFIMSDPTFSYIDMAVYMHFDELCPHNAIIF